MKPIDLEGFDAKFSHYDDPWCTFSDGDEAHKRRAIVRGLGGGPVGRVLEVAAGNGSNSVALERTALRLDATEATESGTALVRRAIGTNRRVRVTRLVLPARFPSARYDVVVVAEVLYYLSCHDMAQVARDVAKALRTGGRLILAHHRIDYPDFAQHANGIHKRFLDASGARWRKCLDVRTSRWRTQSLIRS